MNRRKHARIASRHVPCDLGAICSTSRKSILRPGERDVKGGEDDWEDEGEFEHVCPNRCSDVAVWKGPIYPPQLRGNLTPCPQMSSQRTDKRHPSTHLWCCVRASMIFLGTDLGTIPFPDLTSSEWTEDNSDTCPDYSVAEPDRREGTEIWSHLTQRCFCIEVTAFISEKVVQGPCHLLYSMVKFFCAHNPQSLDRVLTG